MKNYLLITGASSGIGKELALESFRNNYTPLLIGRSLDKLRTVSSLCNDAPYASVDLQKPSSVDELKSFFNELEDGRLVGVINNAGIYKPDKLEDSTSEDWLEQYQINLLSAVHTTKAFIEDLKKSKGSILNISSTLGIRPIASTAAYSCSKAALNNLTLSQALEYANFGVRANCICPGIINTPIHKTDNREKWKEDLKSMQPIGRIGEPQDITGLALSLISPESTWTTGAIIPVDGGILLKS